MQKISGQTAEFRKRGIYKGKSSWHISAEAIA